LNGADPARVIASCLEPEERIFGRGEKKSVYKSRQTESRYTRALKGKRKAKRTKKLMMEKSERRLKKLCGDQGR